MCYAPSFFVTERSCSITTFLEPCARVDILMDVTGDAMCGIVKDRLAIFFNALVDKMFVLFIVAVAVMSMLVIPVSIVLVHEGFEHCLYIIDGNGA